MSMLTVFTNSRYRVNIPLQATQSIVCGYLCRNRHGHHLEASNSACYIPRHSLTHGLANLYYKNRSVRLRSLSDPLPLTLGELRFRDEPLLITK